MKKQPFVCEYQNKIELWAVNNWKWRAYARVASHRKSAFILKELNSAELWIFFDKTFTLAVWGSDNQPQAPTMVAIMRHASNTFKIKPKSKRF